MCYSCLSLLCIYFTKGRNTLQYCTLCCRQVQRNVLQLLINNLYFSPTHNTLQYYILCYWQEQRNVLQFLVLFVLKLPRDIVFYSTTDL